jgi:histidinol-phosphatase (PHP family)
MVPRTNYHTHNQLCDGSAPLGEYVAEAERRGFSALGFTSHAPLPFANDWTLQEKDLETYCREVLALKKSTDMEIYLGLEIDYIPGRMGPADKRWDRYGLEYRIGSVHMLRDQGREYSIDGPDDEFLHLLKETFAGDGTALALEYYRLLAAMIREGGFQILGHLDLIKKKNLRYSFLDEDAPAYREAVMAVLDLLSSSGIMLEINSGGIFRGATAEVYPSYWILKEAYPRGIPIVINADAHTPESVDFHYDESRELAAGAGYREVMVLLQGSWRSAPL